MGNPTFVRFMHEFEQLVNDCLQELPVRLEESRILADDIHDIGSYDGLVVFTTFNFAETEQILDDRDQESLLRFLIWQLHQQGTNR